MTCGQSATQNEKMHKEDRGPDLQKLTVLKLFKCLDSFLTFNKEMPLKVKNALAMQKMH